MKKARLQITHTGRVIETYNSIKPDLSVHVDKDRMSTRMKDETHKRIDYTKTERRALRAMRVASMPAYNTIKHKGKP